MKKLFLTACVALMAMSFTSCSDDNDEPKNDYTISYSYSDCFAYVSENDATKSFVVDETGVEVTFNYRNNYQELYCDLQLKGVPTSKTETTTVTLKNLPAKVNADVTRSVNVDEVKADGVTISGLKLVWLDRNIGDKYLPVVQLFYKVNDTYNVTLYADKYYCMGKTTVVMPGVEKPFSDDNFLYILSLDPSTMTADIELNGAKFAQNMPQRMDMTVKNVKLTLSNAEYHLSADELVPSIGNDPYPAFAFQNLNGLGSPNGSLTLRFNVMGRGSVSASLGAL